MIVRRFQPEDIDAVFETNDRSGTTSASGTAPIIRLSLAFEPIMPDTNVP